MESETNRKIRELLEMFDVDTSKVVGDWNIVGHLKNFTEQHTQEAVERARVEAYNEGVVEGFEISGEGWNGEYPYGDKGIDPTNDLKEYFLPLTQAKEEE